MIFFQLFYEFFLIGLFSFGGGLATIPFLQELAGRREWYTLAELTDMIAVAESTPGPIGVNMASYTGFTAAGPLGVIVATLGLIAPSILIIFLIAPVLINFRQNRDIDGAFHALRPASCALIASVGISMLRSALFHPSFDVKALVLLVIIVPTMLKTKLHPLIFIAFSAAVGVIFKFAA